MGERTDAKRSIESSTRHLTDIAQELSRRASPRYIGEQARETALNKTHEWKEQISSSPLALGILGGALGALIGRSLARERPHYGLPDLRRRTVTADARGYRYGSEAEFTDASSSGPALGERVQDLKDKATDLKDKASGVVANVRDQLPDAAQLTQKAEENPMFVALGGLALGAVAALLLPVTRKERQLLDPVKQRASEALGTLGDKVGDTMEQARDRIGGQEDSTYRRDQLGVNDLSTH